MGEWRDICELACGCVLQQLYDPASEQHREVALHPQGPCTMHLCRLCGDVPAGDSPLCADCTKNVVAGAPVE